MTGRAEAQRREADEEILGVKLAADAEPAAGAAFLQHHRGGAAAEHARERVAVAVRHLGGAVKLDHIAHGVVMRERAARLQRHAAVTADLEVERDHGMGRGEGGIDLAITGAQHQCLGRKAGGKAARRCSGIQDRRQLFGLDRDEVGGVLGQIRIGREYHSDRLADIAQPIFRQQRLAVGAQRLAGRVAKIDRRQIGDVGPGPHRGDAGCFQRRRDIDRAQLGMRIGRAHDPHVQLMRERDVADKAAASGDQRRVLQPRHRAAEHAASLFIGRKGAHGRSILSPGLARHRVSC